MAAKATKATAGYQPPDQGPFHCKGCTHFDAKENLCTEVAGPIAPEGCCNYYEKKDTSTAGVIAENYKKRTR